jgi:integrase/recombinase XerD
MACPSLRNKVVSPHTIRHTTAMHLLNAGVDLSVIALWLGHESIQTTHTYLEADLKTKERALSRVDPLSTSTKRFAAKDSLLEFLERL